MDNIDCVRLRRLDLNTLAVLHTLLQTCNVSRSADRLCLGQPAISHILKRLREHFGDELLCRNGRRMELTPLAETLKQPLADWLAQGQRLLAPQGEFNPAIAEGTLRLAMPDLLEASLLPALIEALQQQAPRLAISIEAMPSQQVAAALADGRVEAAVGYFPDIPPGLRRTLLFNAEFVCVCNSRLVSLPSPLLLRDLASLPHIYTSYLGTTASVIDQRLHQLGLSRRIIASGASLLAIPSMLERIAAVAVLPDTILRLLQAAHPALDIVRIDDAQMDIPIEMIWPARLEQDPLQRFVRTLLIQKTAEIYR
jgi:DNA-binding transcriptional LysR family regulator